MRAVASQVLKAIHLPYLLLVLFGPISAALASPPPSHICLVGDSGVTLDGKETEGRAINIYYLEPGTSRRIAFSAYPEEAAEDVTGFIPETEKGVFAAHGVTVDATGTQPVLTGVNGRSIACRYADFYTAPEHEYVDGLGVEFGVSMGSVVRAAPEVGGTRIGGFENGRHIAIEGDTGRLHDGYTWLKVILGREKFGYVWGGTVCTPLAATPGTADCPSTYGGSIPAPNEAASSGTTAQNAAAAAGDPTIAGRSTLGTRVRLKPDTTAEILTSIPVGAPLRVIGETGAFLDTFQWVEVAYGEGRTGYAWGGSICTIDKELVGVHYPCR